MTLLDPRCTLVQNASNNVRMTKHAEQIRMIVCIVLPPVIYLANVERFGRFSKTGRVTVAANAHFELEVTVFGG